MSAAKSLKFRFLHAVYIGISHCSVQFIIYDTVLTFSAIILLLLDVTILAWKLKKIMQSTVELAFKVLYSNQSCAAAVKCLSSQNGRIKLYSVLAILFR